MRHQRSDEDMIGLTPLPGERAGALREVGVLMLRLGLTAFGGPAAHIAMLEKEVVRQRGWLSAEAFLDLLGATNLIPGPNSTEMVIHAGMSRAGVPGLWLAGLCFILPAALITLAFAAAYVAYGALPQAQQLLVGVKPAVLAIIAAAVWKLGRGAAKNVPLALLGAAVLVLYLSSPPHPLTALLWLGPGAALGAAAATPGAVGLFFLKIGSVLFGGGYVLLAFLQEGLVHHHH